MWERRLRLWSGLVVTVFVVGHLINHALGLVSLEAMEGMRKGFSLIWNSAIGWPILLAAFLLHFLLALFSLYSRSTLRMPMWEAIQIGLGVLIFPLILIHVIGTAIGGRVIGFEPTYEFVIAALWVSDPIRGAQQTVMMFVVWGHVCMGLHFWLRMKRWYARAQPYFYAAAVLLPVLAFLGFARIGRAIAQVAKGDSDYLNHIFEPVIKASPTMTANLKQLEPNLWAIFAVIVGSVLVARVIRNVYRARHGRYHLTVGERRVAAPVGQSILETLRVAGIPHASVCGGRGRCTTCRVHVGDAIDHLPPPGEVEQKALDRIRAEPAVRLACQTRPSRDVTIRPLLPPNATARDASRPGGIQGREQKVAIMFLDIRGSTKLGEEKLPYDVLFILNQFFAEMAAALAETKGHYAQFNGDGLMALYGIDTPIEEGCRQAVAGAAAMATRLDELNSRLGHELASPLRMGLGIHCGEVIVGTMGPPTAQNFSAIGDDVNVAARLESLTKEFGVMLIISKTAADYAGVDTGELEIKETGVRGRDTAIAVYPVSDPRDLKIPATV